MAWKDATIGAVVPEAAQDIVGILEIVRDNIAMVNDIALDALDLVGDVYSAINDPYRGIMSALLLAAEELNADFFGTGIYSTLVCPYTVPGIPSYATVTEGDFIRDAITLSPSRCIEIGIDTFDDLGDPNRPPFSDSAQVVGFALLFTHPTLDGFMDLLKGFIAIWEIDSLVELYEWLDNASSDWVNTRPESQAPDWSKHALNNIKFMADLQERIDEIIGLARGASLYADRAVNDFLDWLEGKYLQIFNIVDQLVDLLAALVALDKIGMYLAPFPLSGGGNNYMKGLLADTTVEGLSGTLEDAINAAFAGGETPASEQSGNLSYTADSAYSAMFIMCAGTVGIDPDTELDYSAGAMTAMESLLALLNNRGGEWLMARRYKLSVKIVGEITEHPPTNRQSWKTESEREVESDVVSVRIKENKDSKINTCDVTLVDPDGKYRTAWFPNEEAYIEIKGTFYEWQPDYPLVFERYFGKYYIHNVSFSGSPPVATFSCKSMPRNQFRQIKSNRDIDAKGKKYTLEMLAKEVAKLSRNTLTIVFADNTGGKRILRKPVHTDPDSGWAYTIIDGAIPDAAEEYWNYKVPNAQLILQDMFSYFCRTCRALDLSVQLIGGEMIVYDNTLTDRVATKSRVPDHWRQINFRDNNLSNYSFRTETHDAWAGFEYLYFNAAQSELTHRLQLVEQARDDLIAAAADSTFDPAIFNTTAYGEYLGAISDLPDEHLGSLSNAFIRENWEGTLSSIGIPDVWPNNPNQTPANKGLYLPQWHTVIVNGREETVIDWGLYGGFWEIKEITHDFARKGYKSNLTVQRAIASYG